MIRVLADDRRAASCPDRRSSWPSRRCSVISVPRCGRVDASRSRTRRRRRIPSARPASGGVAGAARLDRHLVGDDERRIEADAELADQVRVLLLVAGQLREEFARAGLGDRAEVRDHFVAVHADAVVADGERPRHGVVVDADRELGIVLEQRRIVERLEAQLVAGVGGVRDQLAQEDLAVRIQRVDHQVEELLSPRPGSRASRGWRIVVAVSVMAVRRIPRRRLNGSGDSKARARDVASAGLQFPGTGSSIRAGDAGIEQITNDRPTSADACRAHPALARRERPATDDPRRPARHRDDPGRPAVERDRSRPAEQHPAGHVRDCRARRIAARCENGRDRCARRRAAARCRGLGAARRRAELPDAARDDRGDVIGCRHHAADHADGCTPMAAAAHRVRDGALHERAAGRRGAGRAADSAGRVAARRRRLAIVARCVVGTDRRHRSRCAPVSRHGHRRTRRTASGNRRSGCPTGTPGACGDLARSSAASMPFTSAQTLFSPSFSPARAAQISSAMHCWR